MSYLGLFKAMVLQDLFRSVAIQRRQVNGRELDIVSVEEIHLRGATADVLDFNVLRTEASKCQANCKSCQVLPRRWVRWF
jgi:hypothetical protein